MALPWFRTRRRGDRRLRSEMAASLRDELKLYGRLFRHAGPYRLHLGALLLLSLLGTPVALLTPLPLKIAVDTLPRPQPLPALLPPPLPDRPTSSHPPVL